MVVLGTKKTFRSLGLFIFLLVISGCQFGYLVKSGYHQARLLRARVPIDEALKNPQLSPEIRKKLELAQTVRVFAEAKLGLRQTENYTTYVQLENDFVTWAVSAAPRFELVHHIFHYPIVGDLPYKGFFTKEEAIEEEQHLATKNLDTYVRGITAYSTLGWFKDPLLSSMLRYTEYDLVDVIIHETVHATLFIKNAADFNERLATFLAAKGTELFYLEKEGSLSPTLERVQKESHDSKLFSVFIGEEIKKLKQWYLENGKDLNEEKKNARIIEIQTKFKNELQPKLKTKGFSTFGSDKLNNAKLLSYQTYFMDFAGFEKIYQAKGSDFNKFLEFCKSLESESNPEQKLTEHIKALTK